MKKKMHVVAIGIVVLIMAGCIWNENTGKTKNVSDLRLANIEALANGEGMAGATCYSSYHGCCFWNCMNIFNCTDGCTQVRADKYEDKGTC